MTWPLTSETTFNFFNDNHRSFFSLKKQVRSLVVVDTAHCINEWMGGQTDRQRKNKISPAKEEKSSFAIRFCICHVSFSIVLLVLLQHLTLSGRGFFIHSGARMKAVTDQQHNVTLREIKLINREEFLTDWNSGFQVILIIVLTCCHTTKIYHCNNSFHQKYSKGTTWYCLPRTSK